MPSHYPASTSYACWQMWSLSNPDTPLHKHRHQPTGLWQRTLRRDHKPLPQTPDHPERRCQTSPRPPTMSTHHPTPEKYALALGPEKMAVKNPHPRVQGPAQLWTAYINHRLLQSNRSLRSASLSLDYTPKYIDAGPEVTPSPTSLQRLGMHSLFTSGPHHPCRNYERS